MTERETHVQPGAVLRELKVAAQPCLPALGDAEQEPQLTIHRDGERVQRITAVCTCGRRIEIQCDYEGTEEARRQS